MAAKRMDKLNDENDNILTTAARAVGHAAGEAVKALGLESAEGAAPALQPKRGKQKSHRTAKPAKRVSARQKRYAKAGELKTAAEALGRDAGFDDVRYRRIMGKATTSWSEKDLEYIEGLVFPKGHAAA